MYGGTSEAFQKHLKPFIQSAPLQKVRAGVDEERFVSDAERAGGDRGMIGRLPGWWRCFVVMMVRGVLGVWFVRMGGFG